MFPNSLIQEWTWRVLWYAARHHYTNGLLTMSVAQVRVTCWPIPSSFSYADQENLSILDWIMLDYQLTLTFMDPCNMQASLGYGVVCVRTSENRARELYQWLFCNDNREMINVKKKKKKKKENCKKWCCHRPANSPIAHCHHYIIESIWRET